VTATARPPVEFIHAADEAAEALASTRSVLFLDIPNRRYLAIEGLAPPGSDAFRMAIGGLYAAGYAVHFALRARDVAAPVGHLHGLFWAGEPGPLPAATAQPLAPAETTAPAEPMHWRLLLGLPVQATVAEIESAIARSQDRVSGEVPPRPELIAWAEGHVAQVLHVGPYDAEEPTIARLRDGIAAAGLVPVGCHHEIYLSGPQTPPERTRTVIRQPVASSA
jgi:hypothetical protein